MYSQPVERKQLGFIDTLLSTLFGPGGGGGAAAPNAAPAQITTQVSPQISPVFQQQFQPSNSPITAGTSQSVAPLLPSSGAPSIPAMPNMPNLSPVYGPTQSSASMSKWIIPAAVIGIIILYFAFTPHGKKVVRKARTKIRGR